MREIVINAYDKLVKSGYLEAEAIKILHLVFGQMFVDALAMMMNMINLLPEEEIEGINDKLQGEYSLDDYKKLLEDQTSENIDKIIYGMIDEYLNGEDVFQ